MKPELIGILGIVLLLVLLACRVWVGAAMMIVSLVGIGLLRGAGIAFSLAGTSAFTNINSYTYTTIPMFTLMGMIIAETDIGSKLYQSMYKWIGRFRGGLASASICASGLLGAITGSNMIGGVIMSKIALPEMRKKGYEDSFATGSIAAGAPLSVIIPPSSCFIVYGILTETSIGKLFISGLGVGVVQIILYIFVIWVLCKRNHNKGPAGEKYKFLAALKGTVGIVPMLLLILVCFGGMFLGFFTATESGAIGSAGAFIISLVTKQMTLKKFGKILKETAINCGMIFFMLASTYMFVTFMSMSKITMLITSLLTNLDVSFVVMCIILVIFYFILGCFLPEMAMVTVTIPLIFPALKSMGWDPIWLGAFVVKLMALGSISPPVGMTSYVVSGVTGVPVQKVFKGVIPFILVDFVILGIMIAFPQVATWLPSKMF
ncbi:MAG: TRAP transporter large permease [Lachnospiraceae bacterium]|nr:TRAP transporter large permease [Lachnospiraceae bacterium]